MTDTQTKTDDGRQRIKRVMQNGRLLPLEEAKISVMAPGFTFAVTVFEGLRAYWNPSRDQLFIFRLQEHLERLAFSMRVIELEDPPSLDFFAEGIVKTLQANDFREDTYVRVQAYIDDWGDMSATQPIGTSIICRPRGRTAAFTTGRPFLVSSWRRLSDDASPPRIKATANYLNSRLASLEAKRNGGASAILLNSDGTVSEGPGGCIFLRRGNALITPHLTSGILESITRLTLIEIAESLNLEVQQRAVGRSELYLAEEAFYCGTGQEITPIISIDGKTLADGLPGSITRQLQTFYDEVVRGNNADFESWLTPVYGTGKE